MITLRSKVWVPNLRGRQIIEYLLEAGDAEYRRWWPGTHFHLRTTKRHPNGVGNVMYMDEMIGRRRLRLTGVVTEVVPGKKLVWQVRAIVRQPARLELELEDDDAGVTVTHTIRVGVAGWGRALDPLLRLYLSPEFERAMDAHVKAEFPKLGELLNGKVGATLASASNDSQRLRART